jgi:hypothetical protein
VVLGTVAAAVTIAILGACTPLDGRSRSVEVADAPAPAGGRQVEVPPWVTTTAPEAAASVLPATTSPPVTSIPAPRAPSPEPTTTTPPAPAPPPSTAPPWSTAAPARPTTVREGIVADALAPLGSTDERSVAAAALDLVTYDWIAGLPGWQLRFLDGRRGMRGLTFPNSRRIEVYVRGSDTPEDLAHVVAHELGHAVDVTYFSDVQRAAWLAARGFRRDTIWFPGESGVSDFATGAGDFAESFGWVHGSTVRWAGELAPPPNFLQVGLLSLLTGTA